MSPSMDTIVAEPAPPTDDDLIGPAAEGDEGALAELFGRYRKRLRQMVRLRLDRRLQGRVDPIDREIIALRLSEELTNAEAASALDLSVQAASKRYVRALKRLQAILESIPGLIDPS